MSDMTWVLIVSGCTAAVLAALAAWCWWQWRRAQRAWRAMTTFANAAQVQHRDHSTQLQAEIARLRKCLGDETDYAAMYATALDAALNSSADARALLADIEPHLPKSGAGPKLRRRVRDLIGDENAGSSAGRSGRPPAAPAAPTAGPADTEGEA